jgi:GWxTD domain-containing protein
MKKSRILSLLFCLCISLPLTQALDLGVSYAVFTTLNKPYVEVNIEIAGLTITYKNIDSTSMQASVDVLILVKKGEEIVNYEKYTLNSPLVKYPEALLDVKRLSVPNGSYTLEVHATDANNAQNKNIFTRPLKIDLTQQASLSDLTLLRNFKAEEAPSPFNKNGFFMEPLPFAFYDKGAKKLIFYAETYNTKTLPGEPFYTVRYTIEKDNGNNNRTLISAGSQRKPASDIDAILVQMDISRLENGNYWLGVELRSSSGELFNSRNLSFQRSNPFLEFNESEITEETIQDQFVQQLDEASLRYSLRAISAVVRSDEQETLKNVLKSNDVKQMRFMLFRHFARKNPNDPAFEYKEFIKLANFVDKRFESGFRYGFETDRGRTYLRFGKPNDLIHVEDDPSAAPYEIWIYETFPSTGQQRVKFLFYNPSLAGEDFILLHSNARGEIQNPRWERVLYSRNAYDQQEGDDYNDATSVQRNLGRNARVYFEDF